MSFDFLKIEDESGVARICEKLICLRKQNIGKMNLACQCCFAALHVVCNKIKLILADAQRVSPT